jgi:hypothetical protein
VALQSPDFFDRCPAFLAAAWDAAPDLAVTISECIRTLVQSLILADGFASERERMLARRYLRLDGVTLPMGRAQSS